MSEQPTEGFGEEVLGDVVRLPSALGAFARGRRALRSGRAAVLRGSSALLGLLSHFLLDEDAVLQVSMRLLLFFVI